jgi:transcriptional regulator with XRE-family HTH domain
VRATKRGRPGHPVPRLRELRWARDLTQGDLGQLAGVHYWTIHLLECGRGNARPSTIRRLAAALQVMPDDLLGEPARSTERTAEWTSDRAAAGK